MHRQKQRKSNVWFFILLVGMGYLCVFGTPSLPQVVGRIEATRYFILDSYRELTSAPTTNETLEENVANDNSNDLIPLQPETSSKTAVKDARVPQANQVVQRRTAAPVVFMSCH